VLITAWLYTGVFYALLACGGIAILYYAYRDKPEPEQLPRAELAGNRWRSRVRPWVPRIALVGGFAGAWLLNHFSVDVIVVTDGPRAERMKRLGRPDYRLAPGEQRHDDSVIGYDTWVLNSSQHTVRIETQSYGRSLWGASDPTIIPPGTAAVTIGIDYIGPGNPPPSSLQVDGFEAKVGVSSRYWLTWDR
jgi:hypothetical protein